MLLFASFFTTVIKKCFPAKKQTSGNFVLAWPMLIGIVGIISTILCVPCSYCWHSNFTISEAILELFARKNIGQEEIGLNWG